MHVYGLFAVSFRFLPSPSVACRIVCLTDSIVCLEDWLFPHIAQEAVHGGDEQP